jgi:putative flippase GtrA
MRCEKNGRGFMRWHDKEAYVIGKRFIRFLFVGVINTAVGYAIYALLLFFTAPYLLALFLATIAGVTFNYFSIGRLVFKSRGGIVIFYKFVSAYGTVYLLNAGMLAVLIKHFHIDAYLAQALCVPPSVFLSWLLMNCWVYKND